MKPKPNTFATTLGEDDVTVDYTYSPGRPAVMYLRNGDPGYPEEPAEIDIVSVMGPHGYVEIDDRVYDILYERIAEHEYERDAERRAETAEHYAELRRDDALLDRP